MTRISSLTFADRLLRESSSSSGLRLADLSSLLQSIRLTFDPEQLSLLFDLCPPQIRYDCALCSDSASSLDFQVRSCFGSQLHPLGQCQCLDRFRCCGQASPRHLTLLLALSPLFRQIHATVYDCLDVWTCFFGLRLSGLQIWHQPRDESQSFREPPPYRSLHPVRHLHLSLSNREIVLSRSSCSWISEKGGLWMMSSYY